MTPALLSGASVNHTARRAVLVALAYYASAFVGNALRFPPTTVSVLWPPNAILAAALIVSPPRTWIAMLAAALPAHFLFELGHGWSLPLVTGLFLTNCSEAVLVASITRALSDAPGRFDSFKRVGAFLAAVASGVVVSSVLDATVVHLAREAPFGGIWSVRVFANVLTELCVVPPVVALASGSVQALTRMRVARMVEAGALAAATAVLGQLALGGPALASPTFATHDVPLAMLPLLCWAGVRFGVTGISMVGLGLAAVASRAAIAGHRAFATLPADDGLIALQISLSFSTALLMSLAGLLDERRRATMLLSEQLRFQKVMARVSGSLVEQTVHHASAFDGALAEVVSFAGADAVLLLRRAEDRSGLRLVRAKRRADAAGAADVVEPALPVAFARLESGQSVAWHSASDVPETAESDRASLAAMGVGSLLGLPLITDGAVRGALIVQVAGGARVWHVELVEQLRLIGEVVANAMARLDTERALVSSESLNAAILGSLVSHVAVLDASGEIIAVNDAWVRFGRETTGPDADAYVGRNYLDVCRRAAEYGDATSQITLAGLERVIAGMTPVFSHEYLAPHPSGDRWFALTAVPLRRGERGAVISHTDVTARREAELSVQRMQHDLAHVSRVSTMAEMTASLAHQLNQPLTGILSNAQAARRFLSTASPDLQELREICTDIIEDSRRAGDAIRHLREMMARTEARPVVLDLHAILHEVRDLASSDAIIRNVDVRLTPGGGDVHVRGDRIELQQVFLNLLVNAMDAVCQDGAGTRTVRISCARDVHDAVVTVQDSGPGFAPGAEGQLFQPFFTTKPGGVGMGLPVARSIVDAHGGRIWAGPAAPGGATFFVRLPLTAVAAPGTPVA